MAFARESLQQLRDRIDLVEFLSSYLPMKRSGSTYKCCCPFHEEKSASFMIRAGEDHYHCYGCGAHGDAIHYLMHAQHLDFHESVEVLAERYGIQLEKEERTEGEVPRRALKDLLEKVCSLYEYVLENTEEGSRALQYLYGRGIDLDFVRTFRLGLAPRRPDFLRSVLKKEQELFQPAGLLTQSKRDLFFDRITFPLLDSSGSVIGFSARKFREETMGGKYINSPETALFKKSQHLFGLFHARKRIAKERKALLVEGQLDALRAIRAGFDYTVASLGTAWGEAHVKELMKLGVSRVIFALDPDVAGQNAAMKAGHLFQRKGVDVVILPLPEGCDPDVFLRTRGAEAFSRRLEQPLPFLRFLYEMARARVDLSSPQQKDEVVSGILEEIKSYEHPVMRHECLKQLADLFQLPGDLIGVDEPPEMPAPVKLTPMKGTQGFSIDPEKVLEGDLLRWLFLAASNKPALMKLIQLNITKEHFRQPALRLLFERALAAPMIDLLAFCSESDLEEILARPINLERAEQGLQHTIQEMLTRKWLQDREAVRLRLHQAGPNDEEIRKLLQEFDTLKRNPPTLKHPDETPPTL